LSIQIKTNKSEYWIARKKNPDKSFLQGGDLPGGGLGEELGRWVSGKASVGLYSRDNILKTLFGLQASKEKGT
jgi:hypothetical protein